MLDYLRIMINAQKAKMDERGASAVEYGLLIAGIAALIVVVIFAFGGVLSNIFSSTCDSRLAEQPQRGYLLTSVTPDGRGPSGPRPSACRGRFGVAPTTCLSTS